MASPTDRQAKLATKAANKADADRNKPMTPDEKLVATPSPIVEAEQAAAIKKTSTPE